MKTVGAEYADEMEAGHAGYVAPGRGVARGATAGFVVVTVVVTVAAERCERAGHAGVQVIPSWGAHWFH